MGNLNQEIKPIIIPKSFLDYHCLKCGEIPLLHFTHYNINLICSTHKILNIPIDKIFNYINTDYECSICQQSSNKNNIIYCYQCNNYYCNKCINIHNKDINKAYNMINSLEKNIKCKVHNKIYDKYCFKCKLNLCELCEIHKDHYFEFIKDIYPSDEDINNFYETKKIVLDDLEKEEKINEENIVLLYKKKKKKKIKKK